MTMEGYPPEPAVPAGQGQRDALSAKAKLKAQEVSGQALGKARVEIQQRAVQAGEHMESIAQDVRSVGADLLKSGKESPAKLVVQAADKAEQLGGFMKTLDADKLTEYAKRANPREALEAVEDFGRRRPWPVVGGSLALGYAASRLLKASSERRYSPSRPEAQEAAVVPPSDLVGSTGADEVVVTPASPPLPPTPVAPRERFGSPGLEGSADSPPAVETRSPDDPLGSPGRPGGLGTSRSTR